MGQAGFRIGIFLCVMSGFFIFLTEKGSAEHVVSILTFIMGLVFTIVIIILVRLEQR
jgi:hypothetical protein